jgi:hypothetical protein
MLLGFVAFLMERNAHLLGADRVDDVMKLEHGLLPLASSGYRATAVAWPKRMLRDASLTVGCVLMVFASA